MGPELGRSDQGRPAMTGIRQRWVRDVALPFRGAGCLIAPFSAIPSGYVPVNWNGIKTYIHRAVCQEEHGPCPPGHETLHSCHVRACASRAHVKWGTDLENQHDRIGAGTAYKGIQMPWAKLTEEQVKIIRDTPRVRGSGLELAVRFSVTPANICLIRNGTNWKHL